MLRARCILGMPAALTIGDFSRATHLSVKTLRLSRRFYSLAPGPDL